MAKACWTSPSVQRASVRGALAPCTEVLRCWPPAPVVAWLAAMVGGGAMEAEGSGGRGWEGSCRDLVVVWFVAVASGGGSRTGAKKVEGA